MRWPGFRKVRGQLCKRLSRRLKELRLRDTPSYRRYLEAHPEEWAVLDKLCTVTISRFYRDKAVFDYLRLEVLPDLAERALAEGEGELVLWSAGCASGEEPYTLSLIVKLSLASRMQAIRPGFPYRIIASDGDDYLLGRARRGCYPASSLKDLPVVWRELAFGSYWILRR
jgi:chemotaxis protein methyltransferase CheR